MDRRYRKPHSIALGTTLGGLIGAIVAIAITLIGPSQNDLVGSRPDS